MHLSACDQISPSAVHQFVQKATKLELLVLDGCDKMNGTCIKTLATHNKDDITCTFEAHDLAILTAHPLEKLDARKFTDQLATPPQSPNISVSFDPYANKTSKPPSNPKTLSRSKSRSLLSRRSMINLQPAEFEHFTDAVYEERAHKIRERRISKTIHEKPVSNLDSVIAQGRKLSVRRSMSELSLERKPYVPPVLRQPQTNTSYPIDQQGTWKQPKSRPHSMLNIHSKPFNPYSSQSETLPSIPSESQPILLASGRRNRNPSNSSSASENSFSSPNQHWGGDPEPWNNPTQLTANSSTWSKRQSMQPLAQKEAFVDPWAKKPSAASVNTAARSVTARPSRHSLRDRQPLATISSRSSQFDTPTGEFVFSGTNRGRMLIKLKIETRTGGHQDLLVHEVFIIN